MHHLSPVLRRATPIKVYSQGCQDLVRFYALPRIKPHAPLLVRVPVNSFEFHTCVRTPQAEYLMRPGYLILFAPHAFVPQRQLQSSKSPSPPVFLLISTNFTSTLGIPLTSPALKKTSSKGLQWLSHCLSPLAWFPAYAPFTPSDSG